MSSRKKINKNPWDRDELLCSRKENTIKIKRNILIVCEGKKTEPNYFNAIKKSLRTNLISIDIVGAGKNTLSLVNDAIKKMNNYDETWVVFDKDSFSDNIFNSAILLANKNGLKLAYSNECFELWFVLHFDFLCTGITRKEYKSKLDKYFLSEFGCKYLKNDPDIYNKIISRQNIAIKNATNLLKTYNDENYAKHKPSTRVHLLIQELNNLYS